MKTINSGIRSGIDLDRTSSCSAEHRAFLKRTSRRKERAMATAAHKAADPMGQYRQLQQDQAAMRRPRLKIVAPIAPEMERGDGTAPGREVVLINGVMLASACMDFRRAA